MSETNHGGSRKGAGRPPLADVPGTRKNVYLLPSEIAYLKKLGNGSLTAGIKKAIELLTA
jgi:hypothetical protein